MFSLKKFRKSKMKEEEVKERSKRNKKGIEEEEERGRK